MEEIDFKKSHDIIVISKYLVKKYDNIIDEYGLYEIEKWAEIIYKMLKENTLYYEEDIYRSKKCLDFIRNNKGRN